MSLSFRVSGVCLLALTVMACGSPLEKKAEATSAKGNPNRKIAPQFSLKDGDGRTVNLADFKGKVVLLNFWATWCGPCKIEIPWFIDFEQKYKDRGFGSDFTDNQIRAELLLQQLVTQYPTSNRNSDAAYQLGDLYESRVFRHAFALDRLPLSGPGRLIIALTAPEAKRRIVAQNT